ncbi:hypothetical protein GW17_00025422 [Ensete ventricosum]|nr:hypothetical protein GW17_00025422 [Ensete ventricosum]
MGLCFICPQCQMWCSVDVCNNRIIRVGGKRRYTLSGDKLFYIVRQYLTLRGRVLSLTARLAACRPAAPLFWLVARNIRVKHTAAGLSPTCPVRQLRATLTGIEPHFPASWPGPVLCFTSERLAQVVEEIEHVEKESYRNGLLLACVHHRTRGTEETNTPRAEDMHLP